MTRLRLGYGHAAAGHVVLEDGRHHFERVHGVTLAEEVAMDGAQITLGCEMAHLPGQTAAAIIKQVVHRGDQVRVCLLRIGSRGTEGAGQNAPVLWVHTSQDLLPGLVTKTVLHKAYATDDRGAPDGALAITLAVAVAASGSRGGTCFLPQLEPGHHHLQLLGQGIQGLRFLLHGLHLGRDLFGRRADFFGSRAILLADRGNALHGLCDLVATGVHLTGGHAILSGYAGYHLHGLSHLAIAVGQCLRHPGDVADALLGLLNGRLDSAKCLACRLHTRRPLRNTLHRLIRGRDHTVRALLHGGDQRSDLLGRLLAPFGEMAHFLGDDGETPPLFTGARGLDGRVQGQQVRLVGDVADHLHDLADLGRVLPQLLHLFEPHR